MTTDSRPNLSALTRGPQRPRDPEALREALTQAKDRIGALAALRRERGQVHHGPSLPQLQALIAGAGLREPVPGEVFLVVLIARTHGEDPVRPDPFNDFIGILRRHPANVLPEPDPNVERSGEPAEGVLEWWSTLGTAEPGWAPMHGTGRIPTHRGGCARFVTPQLAVGSHGGGYHNWNEDRPAFRQVAPAQIQRYDPETSTWSPSFDGAIAAHAHGIPSYLDWTRLREKGVGDISHACAVPLHPRRHRILLQRGGWTAALDGCSLSLLALELPPALFPSALEAARPGSRRPEQDPPGEQNPPGGQDPPGKRRLSGGSL